MLGPLEIVGAGETIRVRSRLQRLLLSILLLEANRSVSAGRLIDEFWGDRLPDDPAGALRTQVSRLRRVLPTGARLLAEPGGYRLIVQSDAIDVWRFEQLLAAADQCSGDEALPLVDEALALWRGRPLDEFVDWPFARVEQRRLGERYGTAREHQVALLLVAGRVAEAVAAAEALLADQPEREHARGLLMEALYRMGRATEALDVFDTWRRELGEHGLEPSPALREVEARILRHSIAVDADSDAAPERVTRSVPRPVSSFVGREGNVVDIAELLATARLVTLWGAGGVGKTRLAVELSAVVADRYQDGVFFCDLSALSAETAVARAIANTVGVHEWSGRRLEAQLVDRLAGCRLLLILDNCEHVLHTSASIAQNLARSTSGVDVLATSRERLGVDGEHLWEVEALDASGPDSPAVELFVDRARATISMFDPSADDRDVIASVCRRLDGLPLAVELAAARVRGLSLRELLDALDTRPNVLRGGAGTPHRHRSLGAVFDWSYSLLAPVEQRVFDRLAVLRGPFGLDAARAVAGEDDLGSSDVEAAVLGLLDRALLVERAEEPKRRYSMLATVRRYGIEHLEGDGSLDRVAERHAHWILALTERASRGLGSADEAASATTIEANLDELRAAHRWLVGNDLDGSLRLIAALRPYALWRGHAEIFRWSEVTAAGASSTNSLLLSEAQLAASTGAWQRGDLAAARAAAQAITSAGPPTHASRAALEASADVALLAGELERARAEFSAAHELALAGGDELQAVWDIGSAAVAAGYAGDMQDALQLAAAASTIAEHCGSPSARAFAHFAVGEIVARGQPDAAEAHLLQAIELAEVAGSRFVTGLAEVALAALHSRGQHIGAALGHCRSALHRWHRAGAWQPLWVTMRTVVAVLERAGSLEDAATLLSAAQSARTGAPPFGVDAVTMHDVGEQLRIALGDDRFDRYVERGRSLTEEEALEFAVDSLEHAAETVALSQPSAVDASARA
jgi:predicted ATPase/DNA-binding SARP family transcriptional activator